MLHRTEEQLKRSIEEAGLVVTGVFRALKLFLQNLTGLEEERAERRRIKEAKVFRCSAICKVWYRAASDT